MAETWATGTMVCLDCGEDEDVHVWLVGSEPVECPHCGEFACVPVDGFPKSLNSPLTTLAKKMPGYRLWRKLFGRGG